MAKRWTRRSKGLFTGFSPAGYPSLSSLTPPLDVLIPPFAYFGPAVTRLPTDVAPPPSATALWVSSRQSPIGLGTLHPYAVYPTIQTACHPAYRDSQCITNVFLKNIKYQFFSKNDSITCYWQNQSEISSLNKVCCTVMANPDCLISCAV